MTSHLHASRRKLPFPPKHYNNFLSYNNNQAFVHLTGLNWTTTMEEITMAMLESPNDIRRGKRFCRRLVVLTLKKHQDGIWIRNLVDRLHRSTSSPSGTDYNYKIEVRSVEDWLGQGWKVSSSSPFPSRQ